MSDSQSKLDALEAVLGVDETEDLERPEVHRSVGEILGGSSAEPAQPAGQSSQTSVEVVTSDLLASSPVPTPTSYAQTPSGRPREPGRRTEPKVRTSALLPMSFTARFEAARERRWGFPELIESALDREPPNETEADALLARFDDEQRSLRSFSLTGTLMSLLDGVGADWRMNRSQALTVLLSREFDRLRF